MHTGIQRKKVSAADGCPAQREVKRAIHFSKEIRASKGRSQRSEKSKREE